MNCLPVVDQPDQSLHRQHLRRASRHDHGVPSSEPGGARGRRVRREPHPRADHRRRRRPARLGAISMLGSDSQGMGRIGEVICRTWQLASQDEGSARAAAGREDTSAATTSASSATSRNTRSTPRAPSASTPSSARSKPGKIADIVLWRPGFFGIKPEIVVKGGFIAWGAMGDSAASLMTCEPLRMRPQWGAFGRAKQALSRLLRQSARHRGGHRRLARARQDAAAGHGAHASSTSSDMLHNDACPDDQGQSADVRRLCRRQRSRPASRRNGAAGAEIHAAMTSGRRAKSAGCRPASASAVRWDPARRRWSSG